MVRQVLHTRMDQQVAASLHLGAAKDDVVLVEVLNGVGGGGHVGSLQHNLHTRLGQGLGILDLDLVLGGSGNGHVKLGVNAPWSLAYKVLACTHNTTVICGDMVMICSSLQQQSSHVGCSDTAVLTVTTRLCRFHVILSHSTAPDETKNVHSSNVEISPSLDDLTKLLWQAQELTSTQ